MVAMVTEKKRSSSMGTLTSTAVSMKSSRMKTRLPAMRTPSDILKQETRLSFNQEEPPTPPVEHQHPWQPELQTRRLTSGRGWSWAVWRAAGAAGIAGSSSCWSSTPCGPRLCRWPILLCWGELGNTANEADKMSGERRHRSSSSSHKDSIACRRLRGCNQF